MNKQTKTKIAINVVRGLAQKVNATPKLTREQLAEKYLRFMGVSYSGRSAVEQLAKMSQKRCDFLHDKRTGDYNNWMIVLRDGDNPAGYSLGDSGEVPYEENDTEDSDLLRVSKRKRRHTSGQGDYL